MLKIIHLTEKQAEQVNDLYEAEGSCSLCFQWMRREDQKLLISEPQSDRGYIRRTIKVSSLCDKCCELIVTAIRKRSEINKPKIKLEA